MITTISYFVVEGGDIDTDGGNDGDVNMLAASVGEPLTDSPPIVTAEQSNHDGGGVKATTSSALTEDSEKTSFPGYKKKATRYSYFDRNTMDDYVHRFQPASITRRHSMAENRPPPLSRYNRISLDSIPE